MDIYLSTVAMEKNRWSTHQPSYEVSAFLPRLLHDGFRGIELWENHLFLASEAEQQRLYASSVPMIFNTYVPFGQGLLPRHEAVAEAVHRLNAHAIKFNLEACDAPLAQQLDTLRQFAALLPPEVTLLCECHPGTPLEEPADAQAILARLDSARFGAIVHLAPVKGDNARRFTCYGPHICHLHTQLRKPGSDARTRLDDQPGVARDHLRALKAWGFEGSASVEFTLDGATPEETYANCVSDLHFIQEAWR